jgi:multimeric flavodoxin WrbA
MAGKPLRGCIACYKCFENKDGQCAVKKDNLNDYLARIIEADGILLGSPVYFTDVTTNMKALIERCGLVSSANGGLFKHKVGASVVAVRRAGAVRTYGTMNNFFLYNQMFIPGSTYWNLGIGRNPGEVNDDQEGIQTMRNLGKNMAWLLKKIQ